MTDEVAVHVAGLRMSFGATEVLHGVDITVSEHSVLALLGANGAGKSTLCAVASGLVVPTQGRVLITGEDVTELAPHERARRGLLLVPEARVMGDVPASFLRDMGCSKPSRRRRPRPGAILIYAQPTEVDNARRSADFGS